MRTQPQTIIRNLEENNSRLEKEKILQVAADEGLPEFFDGLRMALDPLVTFGVKQVPEATEDGQGLPANAFAELARQLQERELTGHAARDAIHWRRVLLRKSNGTVGIVVSLSRTYAVV